MKRRSPSWRRPLWARTFAALALLGQFGCGSDNNDPADPHVPGGGPPGSELEPATITTTDQFQFVQEVTTASQGVEVTWISDSGLRHTITPVGHAEWEKVETDQRGWVMLVHIFDTPGEYEFRCDNHWQFGMVGKVVVTPP